MVTGRDTCYILVSINSDVFGINTRKTGNHDQRNKLISSTEKDIAAQWQNCMSS